MLLRRRRNTVDDDRDVVVEHGPSLAKGPALIAGSILVAFGLAGLLKNAQFPSTATNFPSGTAQGSNLLGLEVNGWTDFLCITAGALLLFGAAQHHLAKLMSLLVGLGMAACAVIAIQDGDDVLGLAAANGWTKVGFAVAAVVLLLNALMPRTKRRRVVGPATTTTETVDEAPTAATTTHRRGRFGRDRDVAADDRTVVTDREAAAERDAAARREDAARSPRV